MNIGLALPQYDYSVFGERPLQFETIARHRAGRGRRGIPRRCGSATISSSTSRSTEALPSPTASTAGHARRTESSGARRPTRHAGAARGAASGGGPREGPRVARPDLRRTPRRRPRRGLVRTRVPRLLGDDDAHTGGAAPSIAIGGRRGDGTARRRPDSTTTVSFTPRARCDQRARHVQQPRPRVFVGGKGDRLLRLAGRADGWNTCWVWTPAEYRDTCPVLDAACAMRSGAIRLRCGARSASTPSAATTRPISAPVRAVQGQRPRRWSTACHSTVAQGATRRHRRPGPRPGRGAGGARGRDPDHRRRCRCRSRWATRRRRGARRMRSARDRRPPLGTLRGRRPPERCRT